MGRGEDLGDIVDIHFYTNESTCIVNSVYDVFNVSCAYLLVVFCAICDDTNTTARSSICLLTTFSEFLVSPHVATVGCVQLLVTLRHDVCTLCTLLPKLCPMFHGENIFYLQKS